MIRKIIYILLLLIFPLTSFADDRKFDYQSFSELPILHQGRIKPLDSFARSYLLALSGKTSLQNMSATALLAELIFDQNQAYQRKIIRIENPDITAAIGLTTNTQSYYSFQELFQALKRNSDLMKSLHNTQEQDLSLAQRQLLELDIKLMSYFDISRSLAFLLPNIIIYNQDLVDRLDLTIGKNYNYFDIEKHQKYLVKTSKSFIDKEITQMNNSELEHLHLIQILQLFDQDRSTRIFKIIPEEWENHREWFSPWELLQTGKGGISTAKYINAWKDMAQSYYYNDKTRWNESLKQNKLLYKNSTNQLKLKLEVYYNKINLLKFTHILYVLSLLSLIINAFLKQKQIPRITWTLLSLGTFLHLSAIILRIIIMGRPPVATLYESIIFVSFIIIITSILLEIKRRDYISLYIATISGTILQFIALKYAANSNQMEVLVAVLNSNFWLATHVVTITIGYGLCIFTSTLAHIYLILLLRGKRSSLDTTLITFSLASLLFTIIGTILGGIWADQSWGRFWGWDPKENGALLIILWITLLLHGRILGILSPFNFAIGMVVTNIVVVIAWFGVNLLNVGLHSYGFTQNIAFNISLFCAIEILFISGIYLTKYNYLALYKK